MIGVPDDKWGETVKAIVVMTPGKRASATEIIDFTRERLGASSGPVGGVRRRAAAQPSGKILRGHLRDPYWEGKDRQVN